MTETPEPLGRLLARLRSADRRHRVFGSSSHRYATAPLAEADLTAFEATHGVALPADYRAHLATVGSGAGPTYGLQPVTVFGGPLAVPFPLTETTFGRPQEEIDPFEPLDELPGLALLADRGCATASCLVVSGPQRGAVWFYDDGFAPDAPSFDAWFRCWAERSLQLLAREPITARLRPGLTLADAAAITGAPWNVHSDTRSDWRDPARPRWLATTPDLPATVYVDADEVIVSVEPWPSL